jgi:hypothetical protein
MRRREFMKLLSGVTGVSGFDDLDIDVDPTAGNTIINAGADQVTLVGFTGTLTSHDFLFT